MAEQTQDEGGIGVSGYVGGIAGGAAAGHFANRIAANSGIAKVLALNEPTDKFTKLVTDTVVKDTLAAEKSLKLAESGLNIALIKEIKSANVGAVDFVLDAATKTHTMKVTMKPVEGATEAIVREIKGIAKLPEGAKVGEALTGEAATKLFEGEKSFVKTTIAKMEGQLANNIRKASGYFSGIKNVGWGGKAAIIGATVAGVAAGGYALNAMFGPGKHTARVEAQDNAPATGNAR